MPSMIICDSSTLISLSDTCLIKVLPFLREHGGKFLIPQSVQQEIVSTPIHIKRYAFSAVRLQKAIDDHDLEVIEPDQNLLQRLVNSANSVFSVRGRPLQILHAGEAACVAAYSKYKCAALAIDEKTTRLLIEDPEKLRENISQEYGAKVALNTKALGEFTIATRGMQILRSSDLVAMAGKLGYFNSFRMRKDDALHSAIYAIKNAGCSLSESEVEEYQQMKL